MKMNSQQYYDKYKRNQESRIFYKSAAWEKCRQTILERDNYLCQHCLRKGKLKPADMVHHIQELIERPECAFDEDNLISLCNDCHNKEHPDRGKKAKVYSKKINVIKNKKNSDVV